VNNVEMGFSFSSIMLASSYITWTNFRIASDGFKLFFLASEVEKDAVGVAVSAGLKRLV